MEKFGKSHPVSQSVPWMSDRLEMMLSDHYDRNLTLLAELAFAAITGLSLSRCRGGPRCFMLSNASRTAQRLN